MNKQKLAALAKQLEGLVEQDNSESTILNVMISKTENYPGAITIRVNRFLKHDFEFGKFYWDDESQDKDFEINGVTFQYRYFKAVEKKGNHGAL